MNKPLNPKQQLCFVTIFYSLISIFTIYLYYVHEPNSFYVLSGFMFYTVLRNHQVNPYRYLIAGIIIGEMTITFCIGIWLGVEKILSLIFPLCFVAYCLYDYQKRRKTDENH